VDFCLNERIFFPIKIGEKNKTNSNKLYFVIKNNLELKKKHNTDILLSTFIFFFFSKHFLNENNNKNILLLLQNLN